MLGNCKIDSVLLLCQILLCCWLRAQKVELSGTQCGQPWEQAAQFADMESSMGRGEGAKVTTSAGDNVLVCVPGRAPGTVEQQNSKGNYDTIEICISQTKQNAACKLFLRLYARKR